MEAINHRFGGPMEAPDTGSLRGDLLALLTTACAVANSEDGAIISGLMTAAAQNAELGETMHRCLYEAKHPVFGTILGRAKERGEVADPACAGLVHEVLHAMVLSRRLINDCALDEAWATTVADRVLLPVIRQHC
jgi:hypothetical protein